MQAVQTKGEQRLYDEANSNKASFESVYNAPTPTAYFVAMRNVEYQIPQNAQPIMVSILDDVRIARSKQSLRVLDVGCSYGTNAALLKCDVTLDDLYTHYSPEACAGKRRSQLIERDRTYYADRTRGSDIAFVGLDIAGEAVHYAADCGLLDIPWHADFESIVPENHDSDDRFLVPSDIDAIISTGCIGYVTEKTYDRLLMLLAGGQSPWIVSFVLRMFDYEPIGRILARHGYVTEQLCGHGFAQRRFLMHSERQHAIKLIRSRGLHTAELEETGFFYADLFVSRPCHEAKASSLRNPFDGAEFRTPMRSSWAAPGREPNSLKHTCADFESAMP